MLSVTFSTLRARHSPRLAALAGVLTLFSLVDSALAQGTVVAWGSNYAGQLGSGTTATSSPAAVTVSGLPAVSAFAAGGIHSLALVNGSVYDWGNNKYGQLGSGTTTDNPVPAAVGGLTAVTAIDGGHEHRLAIQGGVIYAWGSNDQ